MFDLTLIGLMLVPGGQVLSANVPHHHSAFRPGDRRTAGGVFVVPVMTILL
jgi:hypothetical protein